VLDRKNQKTGEIVRILEAEYREVNEFASRFSSSFVHLNESGSRSINLIGLARNTGIANASASRFRQRS
jgi:hypothetical protein